MQPDINALIRERYRKHVDTVIASPIGFLCDHVEILYDLDHEARATAECYDINFVRAGTVGTHPAFIDMLADHCCDEVYTEHPTQPNSCLVGSSDRIGSAIVLVGCDQRNE